MKRTLLQTILLSAMMLLATNAWAGTYTVKFLNNYSWEHVCAWVWDENNNNLYDEWPGQEMTPDGTGRYVLTFTWNLVPKYIIFNDRGNGNQTGDFEFVNNGIYDANGLVEVEADLTGIATFNLGASPGVSTPEGFFTHDLDGNWNFHAKFCDAEFDGIQFSKGLKMENTTKIFFTTTTISTVTIVQSTWSANTIKLDGMELAVEDAVEGIGCRIYTMEVPAGNHTIGRGSGESGLFYIKVEWDNNYDTIIPDGTYYVMSAVNGTLINAEGNLDATGSPITFTFNYVENAYTIEGVDFCNGKQWTVADAVEGMSGFYTISNADGFLSVSATMTLEQISDGTSDDAVWILLKKGYWEDVVNSTYTIAGTKNLTGTDNDWDIVDDNKMILNDMTGLFEKKFKRITIDSENQPEFKVVQTNMNGENYWYPNGNWVITTSYVGGEGLYDITITFDPSDFKEIGVIAEKRIVFPDDAIVFDFEAAAEAGENPENFNGTVNNGHAFYGWEKFDKTDSKRQDYKGYVWTEGSLLPQVCQVWRRSDRINGNVKGDGLYCPSDKEMAIDGLEPGSKVIIVYDATNAAEGDKEMIWAVGDGTSEGGLGTPRATATINGIEAVSGETTIPSGAEIAVKSVTPAENGSGYIVVKVKKGMTIKQIAIVNSEDPKPQYFVDFEAGSYYIIDYETGLSMAAGGSWGVHGIVNDLGLDLILTPNKESRSVTIDSRVSNGGNSHFLGNNLYMDQPEFGWYLDYQGFGFYITDGSKYINLDEDNNLVLSDTPREWIIVSAEGVKNELLDEMSLATIDNPVDATLLITAQNFNCNDLRNAEAWSVSGACNLSTGNAENRCAESLHSTFTVSQAIVGAPKGTYQLTAQGFYRQDDGYTEDAPVFFIGTATGQLPMQAGSETSASNASDSFTNGLYTIAPITFYYDGTGDLTVGIKGTAEHQWVVFDNFRLTYLGTEMIIEKDPQIYTEFVEATGTLTYYYDNKIDSRSGVTELYDPEATRFNGYNGKVLKAVIDPSMLGAPLTSTKRMFYYLSNMESIDGLENLNTENVTDMNEMFYRCQSLTTLDLSTFDTHKVKDMEGMFENCTWLEILDITSFDVSNVTNFMLMFSQCTRLKAICCFGDWSTSSAQSGYMFYGCRALCGDKGTAYTDAITDKTYARPDGGTSAPGYFTADTMTGISLTPALSEGEGAIYNLAGQRLSKHTKGINIVGDKKIIVK